MKTITLEDIEALKEILKKQQKEWESRRDVKKSIKLEGSCRFQGGLDVLSSLATILEQKEGEEDSRP